ncbi:MAG: phosphoenolpyruvate kinase [Acidobacteria bacterium]|nr:phosphoenolpyruvate kinase [Acidobacteriota bacterium]
MEPTHLSRDSVRRAIDRLKEVGRALAARYPGESSRRQPVHTVYGGAQLFRSDTTRRLGELARRALDEYGPDPQAFGEAIGLSPALRESVYGRVRRKLESEPVEDFRIDFEDGYGNRPDAEEDGHAASAAQAVANAMRGGTLPPFIGIRIKPFSEELSARSIRTLDIFIGALATATGGRIPPNFVVTLPKVTSADQVSILVDLLEQLESALTLASGSLALEIMIETTQSVIDTTGVSAPLKLVAAARGRCVAAHFGTYDYTAACNITAAHQVMTHPACDFAKHVMQISLAGTGVWIVDGATNIMPVPVHRAPPHRMLSAAELDENRSAVHRAWRLHVNHVRHSLVNAYYQGWDLHPAQLPARYATLYAFFLEGLDEAGERLRNFVGKAAQATLVGEVFDDAATGQGLLNYFLRAVNCGAMSEGEAVEKSGLTLEELRTRSFVEILKKRSR